MSKPNRGNSNKPQVNEEPVDLQTEEEERTEDSTIEKAATSEKQLDPVTPPSVNTQVQLDNRYIGSTETEQPSKATATVNELQLFLNKYKEVIVGSKNEEDVAKTQLSFLNKVKELLNKPNYEDTRVGLNAILKFFKENRESGLDEYNVFRGAAHWPGGHNDYVTLRSIIWIFLETADPVTRKASVTRLNINKLESTLNPTQYNNLISFYS